MSDEKDARSYLNVLAAKMTDELDSLKTSGALAGVSEICLSLCCVLYMFILWHACSILGCCNCSQKLAAVVLPTNSCITAATYD